MSLRIVTFNIRHGEGLSGRIDLEAQAELLRALHADAVFLQEVDVGSRRTGGVDQARALAEMAGFPYHAFGRCRDCQGGSYGNAILSRFRPAEVANALIATPDPLRPRMWRGSPILLEQRGILRMSVEADGETVHLLCSHFGFVPEERPPAARFLLDLIRPLNGTIVAGGDLNVQEEDAEELRLLSEVLTDRALVSDPVNMPEGMFTPARTFPADSPRHRLDYLFFRGAFVPTGTAVVPTQTSDHLPLVVDLVACPKAGPAGVAARAGLR